MQNNLRASKMGLPKYYPPLPHHSGENQAREKSLNFRKKNAAKKLHILEKMTGTQKLK